MKSVSRLMAQFGVPEPLIGDLVEGLQRHSRLWFWRQAFAAIAQTTANTVFQRPADSIRVATLSVGSIFICYQSILKLYLWASRLPFIDELPKHSRLFLFAWHIYVVPLNVLWCFGAMLSGWVAVRFTYHNRTSFALLSVAVQVPLALWWGLPIIFRLIQYHQPLKFAVGHLFDVLVIVVGMPLCALIGGMWSASERMPFSSAPEA